MGRRPLLAGVGLALLTPVLVAVAFPPVGLWPAIWVAFVPMLVAQHRVLPARWSALGPAIGIGGMFGFHLSPGLVDGGLPALAVVWPVAVGALVAPLFWRSRAFHEATGYRWFVLSAPVAWVGLDFLRSTGNEVLAATFGYPAYAMWDHPALLQPLSVFGINGLELLVLTANWALAAGVLAALDRRAADSSTPTDRTRDASATGPCPSRREFPVGGALAGVGGVALAVAVWCGASVAMLEDPAPQVTVAAVQTGVDRDSDDADERFRRDVEQTRIAAAQGAQLVVWNEKGLDADPREERTEELRALAAETGAHLVIGFGFEDDRGRHHNEVTLLTPEGDFVGVYGKDHPGTFAGDFSDTGGTYPVYETALGPVATIICYDLDFTDTARHMARGGARLVATPSADVPSLAYVHFTHLVFRAIENRVAMVKADNEFDSAIIDPYGRVLAKATSWEGGLRATLVAAVPLGSGRSPWVSLGDWVGWACVAGAAALVVGSWRVRRRASRVGEQPA
jgi:apolipoprotein N-acyltransferase